MLVYLFTQNESLHLLKNSRFPRVLTYLASSLQREPSLGLSELLNAGEPVTSDRGSWGMRESSHCDSWHRTAPRYR